MTLDRGSILAQNKDLNQRQITYRCCLLRNSGAEIAVKTALNNAHSRRYPTPSAWDYHRSLLSRFASGFDGGADDKLKLRLVDARQCKVSYNARQDVVWLGKMEPFLRLPGSIWLDSALEDVICREYRLLLRTFKNRRGIDLGGDVARQVVERCEVP